MTFMSPDYKRSELILCGMVDNDLKNCVQTALVAFDLMLGQPKWKSASFVFIECASVGV